MGLNRTVFLALLAWSAFACNNEKTKTVSLLSPPGSGTVTDTLGRAGAPSGAPGKQKPDRAGGHDELGAPCVLKEHDKVEVALFAQEKSMLCWAGVAQMVANYFSIANLQCDQVQARNPSCQCSGCPASIAEEFGDCNMGGWPQFARVNLASDQHDNEALSLKDLKTKITCAKQPVAFAWKTGVNAGHIMVAYGYDGDTVLINDPAPPCDGDQRIITYDEFAQGEEPGTTSHWRDYYDFRKTEAHAER